MGRAREEENIERIFREKKGLNHFCKTKMIARSKLDDV